MTLPRMNVLCITHEDNMLGVIPYWAEDRGYNLQIWTPYRDKKKSFPDIDNIDFLIVGGGFQRIVEREKYPYLGDEIELIRRFIKKRKPVLGICLGSQLVGESFGAKGECSPNKEVGILPITLTEEGLLDPLFEGFLASFPVFHWHNDMPGVTDDAVVLAHSEGCPRQIVRYSPMIYGFQCHLEFGEEIISNMIESISNGFEVGEYVQTPEVLLAQDREEIHRKMFLIFDRMIDMA